MVLLLLLLSLLLPVALSAAAAPSTSPPTGPITCSEYNANFLPGSYLDQRTGTVHPVQQLVIPMVSQQRMLSAPGMLFSNLCNCDTFTYPGQSAVPLSKINLIIFQSQNFSNSDITPIHLRCLTGIHFMVLSGNFFPTGPDPQMFSAFRTSLLALDISSCNINSLDAKFMTGLTNIYILYMQGNWFRTLPAAFFDPAVSKLRSIDLSGNLLLETLPLNIFSKLLNVDIVVQDLPSLTCLPPVQGNIYIGNTVYPLPACTPSVDVVGLKAAGKTINGCLQLSMQMSIDWGVDAAANLQQFLMAIVTMTRIDSARFINPTAYRDASAGTTVVNLEILPHTRSTQVIVDYAAFSLFTMLGDPTSAIHQDILTSGISVIFPYAIRRRWCPTNNTYLPETWTCTSPVTLSAQVLGMPTLTATTIFGVIGIIVGVSVMNIVAPRLPKAAQLNTNPAPQMPSQELGDVDLQSSAPNGQANVPVGLPPMPSYPLQQQDARGFNRLPSPNMAMRYESNHTSYQVNPNPDEGHSQHELPPSPRMQPQQLRNPNQIPVGTSYIATSDSEESPAQW